MCPDQASAALIEQKLCTRSVQTILFVAYAVIPYMKETVCIKVREKSILVINDMVTSKNDGRSIGVFKRAMKEALETVREICAKTKREM